MRFEAPLSIFAEMTALARAYNAINLAQGLMELPPDPTLLEETQRVFSEPEGHQYTLPMGLWELREVLARLSSHYYGVSYDPETEITISVGATEGIYAAVLALTKPGDKVVYLEPAYDSYLPAIELAEAKPVPLRLEEPNFTIPWERLEAAFAAGARLCLLNFPHNPTGRVLRTADLLALERLSEQYPHVRFVVDEAYELMTWHPTTPQPALPLSLRKSPLLRQHSVIVGSLGKLLGMTGWRLGYLLAPAALMTAIRSVRQFISFCAPSSLQRAAANYLGKDLSRARYFDTLLLERRAFFRRLLPEAIPLLPCEGAYFYLLPYRPFFEEASDVALAKRLTIEAGVALIPLSPFYHDGYDPGYLRICFARSAEVLRVGAERLALALLRGGKPK